jgi:hypothetical protein
MPERANSLVSGLFAGTLASAALLGLSATASSAAECLENPDLRTAKPGHWYYHSDWAQHRRCWFFVPAEVTADTPVSAPPATVSAPAAAIVGDYSVQSLLSYFAARFSQPPSPPPQQMEGLQRQPITISDRTCEATQISPKHARPNKTVARERPQIAPPPTRTGAAVRRDQPEQSASNERPNLPLNEADREALFQEFVKWGLDRKLFGAGDRGKGDRPLSRLRPPTPVEQAGIH